MSQLSLQNPLFATYAIAACLKNPHRDCIIPSAFDKSVARKVAKAVFKVAMKEK